MKKTTLFAIVLLLSFPSVMLAKFANLYEQFQNINAQWNMQQDIPQEVYQLKPLENDREAIRTHLCFVENILRKRDVSALSPLQKSNRLKNLANLHTYWQQGNFPINTQLSYRNPIFIDPYDNFCAVGFLIKESGNEAISREIQRTQNFAYVKEIHSEGLEKWAADCGLTVGELAWIQPGYMPTNYVTPMKAGLGGKVRDFYVNSWGQLSAVGEFSSDFATWYSGFAGWDWLNELTQGSNGTIYAIENWDNQWFLGGDFTQINGQNIAQIAQIDANGQVSAMGMLNGTVRDLKIFNGELYAGGSFGIAKWNGTDWQSLGICNGEVRCLYEWQGNLIAGGNFSVIGAANATNIASYNGFYFSNMENGVPKAVNAISEFKGKLFVGTDFDPATQTNMSSEKVYYYNGIIWAFADFTTKGKGIYAMQEKFGNLYVGGDFDYLPMVGYFGGNMMKLIYYNDTTFALDGFAVLDSPVYCLAAYANGNELFVGGEFFNSFGPLSQPLNSVGYFALTPSAVTPPSSKNSFKMYPNPAQNIVNIRHEIDAKIELFDINGRVISLEIETISLNESRINVENLPKGLYLVRIGNVSQKLKVE